MHLKGFHSCAREDLWYLLCDPVHFSIHDAVSMLLKSIFGYDHHKTLSKYIIALLLDIVEAGFYSPQTTTKVPKQT